MYSMAPGATSSSRRERTGLGRMPARSSSQAHPSSRARMWQPHEQKKRPKIAVASTAVAMKRKPAVMMPSSSVYMTSLSSSGARVVPVIFQCAMCRPKSR